MADKEKQIDEMVMELAEAHHEMDVAWTNYFIDSEKFPKPKTEHLILAEHLYNAGYRKQSEVDKLHEVIFMKEDLMQSIAKERNYYYDELQKAKSEVNRLRGELARANRILREIKQAHRRCNHWKLAQIIEGDEL
jgi:hypothetical protein